MGLFQKGLQFRLQQGWTSETVIALWTVAHTQRMLDQLAEAITTLDEFVRRWRALEQEPDGYTWEEQGECLLAQGNINNTKLHFQKAWELLRQDNWLVANEPARLDRLKRQAGISETYIKAQKTVPRPPHMSAKYLHDDHRYNYN